MSFLDRKFDIYVSYAHANDDPDPWVGSFVQYLAKYLDNNLDLAEDSTKGRSARIEFFKDDSFFGQGSVCKRLKEHVRQSATLLIFMSKAYLKSKYCREELSCFVDEHGAEASERIFIVELEETTRDEWPAALTDQYDEPMFGEVFFKRSTGGGGPRQVRSDDGSICPSAVEPIRNYADGMFKHLTVLRDHATQRNSSRAVIQAAPAPGRVPRPLYKKVSDDLAKLKGLTEYPENELSTRDSYEKAIQSVLPTCDVFDQPRILESLRLYCLSRLGNLADQGKDYAEKRRLWEECLLASYHVYCAAPYNMRAAAAKVHEWLCDSIMNSIEKRKEICKEDWDAFWTDRHLSNLLSLRIAEADLAAVKKTWNISSEEVLEAIRKGNDICPVPAPAVAPEAVPEAALAAAVAPAAAAAAAAKDEELVQLRISKSGRETQAAIRALRESARNNVDELEDSSYTNGFIINGARQSLGLLSDFFQKCESDIRQTYTRASEDMACLMTNLPSVSQFELELATTLEGYGLCMAEQPRVECYADLIDTAIDNTLMSFIEHDYPSSFDVTSRSWGEATLAMHEVRCHLDKRSPQKGRDYFLELLGQLLSEQLTPMDFVDKWYSTSWESENMGDAAYFMAFIQALFRRGGGTWQAAFATGAFARLVELCSEGLDSEYILDRARTVGINAEVLGAIAKAHMGVPN